MKTQDRKEWRRQRLIELLRDHFDNTQAALADRVGIPPTLISSYINGRKGIGESMRDKIEAGTGFYGWFDQVPAQVANEPRAAYHTGQRTGRAPAAVTIDLDADCLVVWQQLQQLPDLERQEWRARLEIAAAEAKLRRLHKAKTEAPDGINDSPPAARPKAHDPA